MSGVLDASSPFKFLEYYEERDADVFGGRERESVDVADRITQARTHIFYGRSGLGKTSLLLAGVFPELRQRGWTPIYIRTLADPAHDLLQACAGVYRQLNPAAPSIEHAPGSSSRDRILAILRMLASESRVVLTLDQFEEFFIRFRARPEVRSEFVSIIAAIAREKQIPVHVVFSLREDYLAEMDEFRNELPDLFEDEYRLRAMTAFGVRQAVTRPLDAAAVPYQGRLVTRLLDRLSEQRFDPVVLQILCNEVYGLACARGKSSSESGIELRADDLDAVGDIDQVFRRYLDTAAAHLDADQQLVARGVLRCLTTQEHTKQALLLQDFTHAFVRISEHEAKSVLELLAGHRLIRIDRRGHELGEVQIWYELTHDRLVPIITEWLRLDIEFNRLLAAEDLISTSVRSGLWRASAENLLGPGHLDNVVGPFRTRLRLSPDKLEFVLRSAIYHHHQDVGSWARDYDAAGDADSSEALVFTLLRSGDEQMRRGCVFAAGQLGKLGDELATALIHASLSDESELVRRAAGGAIGYARSPKLITRLIEQGQAQPSKRVVEVLADIYSAGQELADVPHTLRWRARRLVSKRTAKRHHEQISEARPIAAIGAVLAGVLWIISLLPYGLLWSFGYVADQPKQVTHVFWLSSAVLAAVVVLCVPVAWALGGAAVLRTRARTRASWLGTIFGSWTYQAIALMLAVVAIPVLSASSDWLWGSEFEVELIVLIIAASYWLLMPMTVALARQAIAGERSFARASFWSVLGGIGLPMAIPWAMIGLSEGRESVVLGLAGLVWSAMTATLSAALARVGVEMPALGLLNCAALDPNRKWARVALVGISLTSLAFVFGSVGPGVVPWPHTEGELAAGQQLELSGALDPYGGVPATRYHSFSIAAPSDTSDSNRLVVELTASGSGYGLFSEGVSLPGFWMQSESDPRRLTLLARPGRHSLALVAEHERSDYQLTLDGRAVLQSGPLALEDDQIVYTWTRWTRNVADPESSGDEFAGADLLSSVSGTASPHAQIRVSFGERFVVDSSIDQAEFSGMQLHCQGDAINSQPSPAVANSRFASDGPFVEAPAFDTGLASTCTVYADAHGNWTMRLAATVSRTPGEQFQDLRMAAAVKRERSDRNAIALALRASLQQSDEIVGQQLSGQDFSYADFSGKTLRTSSFRNADLSGTNFRLADLGTDELPSGEPAPGNDFGGAHGAWADFRATKLVAADFTNATLPTAQFQGVRGASDAKFIGAVLNESSFDDANFEGANFAAAKLADASFVSARARAASFRDAELMRSNFTGADLREADFTGADLRDATLDLRSSETDGKPVFDDAKLSGARLLVSNPKLRIKQVCGTGSYTLVVYETTKSGSKFDSEQTVPLPSCSKATPSEVETEVAHPQPLPETAELLRGSCRTAPVPLGIFRTQTNAAEEICRRNPARKPPSERELAEGRQKWSTGQSLDGIEVVCSCELRSAYVNKAPNNTGSAAMRQQNTQFLQPSFGQ